MKLIMENWRGYMEEGEEDSSDSKIRDGIVRILLSGDPDQAWQLFVSLKDRIDTEKLAEAIILGLREIYPAGRWSHDAFFKAEESIIKFADLGPNKEMYVGSFTAYQDWRREGRYDSESISTLVRFIEDRYTAEMRNKE